MGFSLFSGWDLAQLDHWGEIAAAFARPALLQSSALILALLSAETLGRDRLRPALRHALWLLVLLKLLLPPSLALPTSPAYWIPRWVASPAESPSKHALLVPVPAQPTRQRGETPAAGGNVYPPQPPPPSRARATIVPIWAMGSASLLLALLRRTRRLNCWIRTSVPCPSWVQAEADALRRRIGLRHPVDVRLAGDGLPPALCGLFRYTLLVPRTLLTQLSPGQLRSVLLHELIHARRGDPAVHALQLLVLTLWWWHPLAWVAHRRLRTAREHCVDDTVAWALGRDSEDYPTTLVAVARATLRPPRLGLGFLGILESQSTLRQRIQRLLTHPHPAPATLRGKNFALVTALALACLPLAPGPRAAETPTLPSEPAGAGVSSTDTAETLSESDRRRLLDQLRVALSEAEERLAAALQTNPENPDRIAEQRAQVERAAEELRELTARLNRERGLVQRTYRIPLPRFIEALEQDLHQPLGNDPGRWPPALAEALRGIGVHPQEVRWDHREGTVTVIATPADLAAATRLIDRLAAFPQVILLESLFFLLGPDDLRALHAASTKPGSEPPAGATGDQHSPGFAFPAATLDPSARQALLDVLTRRLRIKPSAGPRITTLAGRSASIEQRSTTNGSPTFRLAYEPGQADALGRLPLLVRASYLEIQGPPPETPPVPPAENEDSSASQVAPRTVHYLERSLTNGSHLPDQHTLLLTDLGGAPTPAGVKTLLVLVRATQVDPAGNPVHPPPPTPASE